MTELEIYNIVKNSPLSVEETLPHFSYEIDYLCGRLNETPIQCLTRITEGRNLHDGWEKFSDPEYIEKCKSGAFEDPDFPMPE